MISPAAAVVVWLGATLIVVADGRRGLAAGLALAALGLSVLAFLTAGVVPAVALASGGAIAAARRYGAGPEAWGLLPPGSTPRLVLCIAAALVAFWVSAGITSGPFASLRFAAMIGAGLAAARVLSSADGSALLSALVLLGLSAASVTAIAIPEPSVWPYVVAGLLVAVVGWVPLRRASVA